MKNLNSTKFENTIEVGKRASPQDLLNNNFFLLSLLDRSKNKVKSNQKEKKGTFGLDLGSASPRVGRSMDLRAKTQRLRGA